MTKNPDPGEFLDAELNRKQRVRHGHPGRRNVHALTAKDERKVAHRRVKSKRYDGRGVSHKSLATLPRVKEALENFYKTVDLDELQQALELSDDPKYLMLLNAIHNPRFINDSFSSICKKCRLTIKDVVEVWHNHLKAKALARVAENFPDVAETVAKDSITEYMQCTNCQGKGRILGAIVNGVEDPACPACYGRGTIKVIGDKDRTMLTFEAMGFRKPAGSQVVNVNVNKGGVPSLEDQLASVQRIFDAEFREVTNESDDPGEEVETKGIAEKAGVD